MVWSESQDSLLPPRKQQVCSYLNFNFWLRYSLLFFLKKNYKSILRNGDKRPNYFDGSYWLFLLQKEIILLDFTELISVIILSSVCYCRPKLPVNMHDPFVMLAQ